MASEVTRARVRRIQELMGWGYTAEECAADLGVSKSRVLTICDNFNLVLAKSGQRRLVVECGMRNADIIRKLATGAGVTPSVMVARIVQAATDATPAKLQKQLDAIAATNGVGKSRSRRNTASPNGDAPEGPQAQEAGKR
jgi:hypothetical protein